MITLKEIKKTAAYKEIAKIRDDWNISNQWMKDINKDVEHSLVIGFKAWNSLTKSLEYRKSIVKELYGNIIFESRCNILKKNGFRIGKECVSIRGGKTIYEKQFIIDDTVEIFEATMQKIKAEVKNKAIPGIALNMDVTFEVIGY